MSTDSIDDPTLKAARPDFLQGGGEMGERMRAFDWSSVPIGAPGSWPQSLKTTVRIVLNSRYPMFIWWGAERLNFYNDAYVPILGARHPAALARPAKQTWAEIWDVVGPLSDAVLEEGRATWNEELLLIMERNQFLEETYFTFSYSPVPSDEGGVGGMFCACTEETHRVLNRRRLRTLSELAERAAEAKTAAYACEVAAATLSDNAPDLPFTLLYLIEGDAERATLAALSGLDRDGPASPSVVDVESSDSPWPFRQVVATGKPVEVNDLTATFGPLPGGPWPESSETAVVLPMAKPGLETLAGFVVAGVSPRLALTRDYKDFLQLLSGHVASAVANARAHEEERRRAKALAELDRAKTAFFSNVSHEFRTPLTLMLGPVEGMLGESDAALTPSRTRRELELVHRNGLRLLKLVNTMLDFSRIEAGRVRAHYEPVDLARCTADLASVFRSAIEHAGLRLKVTCPPLPEPVYVDRDMWEKIVLNLISNAFKFTHRGEIEVRLEAIDGAAQLTVSDTGVGIPEAEISRIFERFHRVADARGRTHEGTGIGLSFVRELVRLHGGSVRVESVLDEGSRFFVTVPFGKDHLDLLHVRSTSGATETRTSAEAWEQEARRSLPASSRDDIDPSVAAAAPVEAREPIASDTSAVAAEPRPRILLADDNADMRDYVDRLLRDRFVVETVTDGQAALDAARSNPPDLVVSDVMMPRLDGFELLRELRADPRLREIPVIMLSARAGEEARVEGMERGADDYLIKPFSARELVARVESHIKMAAIRNEAELRLRQSEERFRSIFDTAGVSVWVEDLNDVHAALDALRADGVSVSDLRAYLAGHPEFVHRAIGLVKIVDVNAETLELFRAESKDELLDSLSAIFTAETEPVFIEELIALAEGRETFEMEAPLKTLDGRPIVALLTVCFGPRSGDYSRVVVTLTDITHRKAAESALREREQRFQSLADTAPAMLWLTDTESRCTFLSRGWFEYTGQTEAEGLDVGWLSAVHPEDRERTEKTFFAAAKRREPFTLDYRLRTEDGTYRWVMDTGRPRFDPEGAFLGYIGSVIDANERKQVEELLARANEELELRVRERTAELERLTDRLRRLATALSEAEQRERRRLAAVLHDHLQQLLVASKMRVDELAMSSADARSKNDMTRLADLLDQALQASRSLTEELRPPALYEGGLVPALRWLERWMEKTHGLKVHLDADLGENAVGDNEAVLLFESVRELLLNVVKHAKCDEVFVELEQPSENEVRITVRDEGAGFDTNETLESGENRGFGLFSIRERLQVLGGSATIVSAPGRGTTVTLLVPTEPGRGAAEPPAMRPAVDVEASNERDASEARIRVLLADDHNIVREGIASLLRNAGDIIVVAEVEDGREAVDAARAFRPDVAVLDVNLPNMTGIEAARAISRDVPEVQIVGLSVQTDKATKQAMMDAGAKTYVAKGEATQKLVESIRDLAKRTRN